MLSASVINWGSFSLIPSHWVNMSIRNHWLVPTTKREDCSRCFSLFRSLVILTSFLINTSESMSFRTPTPVPRVPVTSLLICLEDGRAGLCNHAVHPALEVFRSKLVGLWKHYFALIAKLTWRTMLGWITVAVDSYFWLSRDKCYRHEEMAQREAAFLEAKLLNKALQQEFQTEGPSSVKSWGLSRDTSVGWDIFKVCQHL